MMNIPHHCLDYLIALNTIDRNQFLLSFRHNCFSFARLSIQVDCIQRMGNKSNKNYISRSFRDIYRDCGGDDDDDDEQQHLYNPKRSIRSHRF